MPIQTKPAEADPNFVSDERLEDLYHRVGVLVRANANHKLGILGVTFAGRPAAALVIHAGTTPEGTDQIIPVAIMFEPAMLDMLAHPSLGQPTKVTVSGPHNEIRNAASNEPMKHAPIIWGRKGES